MLEDDQKLRLITAAVRMQDIIATLEMDQEFRILSDTYCQSDKSLQDEVQTPEHDNTELRVAGDDDNRLPSQPYYIDDIYSSLNKTICDLSKLIDQINNNLAVH